MPGDGNILLGQLGLDITQLKGQVDAVNKLLNSIGKDSKANVEALSNTYSELAKNIAKASQADSNARSKSQLAELTGMYKQLTSAQNEYVRALKSGDTFQQSQWSGHIANVQKAIEIERDRLLTVQMTKKEEEAFLTLTDKIANAESTFNKKANETNDILSRAQNEYRNLVKAQKAYSAALEREDGLSANKWKSKMEESENSIAALEREASALEKTSAVYKNTMTVIQQMKDAKNAFENTDKLAEITSLYSQLKDAQSQYMKAYSSGDAKQQENWQTRIDGIKELITAQTELLNATNLTESELEQYKIILDKIAVAESEHGNKTNHANEVLKTAQSAYKDLTDAQKGYLDAMNRGDTAGMQFWSSRIEQSTAMIANLEMEASTLDHESEQYKNITKIIEQMKGAQADFNIKVQQSNDFAANMSQQFSKLFGIIKMIAGVSLVKIWNDALNYAKEYDKALTDIALVTQKPIENVRAMGDEYRKIANDLGVTSTSIAQAASAVYRQGYTSDKDVNGILRGITKFGAISDLSTNDALKTMTASMQNFKKDSESAQEVVERIGDTWSYMGDSVATNSTEIAEAMSKASASVKSVGLEFERASAYAAILLAKTQQSGQVIGTQLNSLASRYGKVTSTGYKKITSDDEGEALSFNDISKSLQVAGIQMYDIANKTFLPLSKVLDDLAEKWVTLEADQRNYIATSMAGTRGMNYFLTLMENYNEAMNLEQGAGQNRGIMNDKYETWLKGVEAAQNNFKNSVESLYSVLKSDVLVSFYNGMANIVDVFTAGTNAVNGFNLKVPLVASGIMLVVAAVMKLKTIIHEMRAAKTTTDFLTSLTSPAGFGVILASITAAISIFGAIKSSIENAAANRLAEYNQQIEEKTTRAENIRAIADELDVLAGKAELSTEETQRFRDLCAQLAGESDWIKAKYGEQADGFTSIGDAASAAKEEVQKLIAEMDALAVKALPDAIDVYDGKLKKLYSERDYISLDDYALQRQDLGGNMSTILEKYIEQVKDININGAGIRTLEKYLADFQNIKENINTIAPDASEELIKAIDDAYILIAAEITTRNSEIEALAGDLQNILNGIFGSITYSDFFLKNTNMREIVSNMMLGYDWGDMDARSIQAYVQSFMSALMKASETIDVAQLFNGENPFAKLILEDIVNGFTMGDNTPFEMIADIMDGMSLRWAESMADSSGMFGNAVAQAAQQYADIVKGILGNAWGEDWGDEISDQFYSAVEDGKFTYAMLEAYKQIFDNIKDDPNFADKRRAAMEAMLGGEESFFEWKAEVYPNLTLSDDGEESVKAFRDQVQAELDAIELMRDQNGGVYVSDADSERAEHLRGLLEQIDALMASISEKSVFGEDMSTDTFQSSLDKLNALAEAYADISSGEFDGDFKSLLEDIPELTGMIGDPDTTLEAIQLIFDELYNSIKETADALGIALPELQDYSSALSAAFDPTADLTSAFKKLNAGEKLGADLVSSLGKAYPNLQKALKDYEKGTISAEKMANKLNKALEEKSVREFTKDLKSAVKDVNEATKGTIGYEEAMLALGDLFTGNQWSNLDSLEFATQQLDNIKAACNGDIEAFQALQEAAFVNLVGTSSVDFSALHNGLVLEEEAAIALGNTLAKMGLGYVETIPVTSQMQYLKPTANGFEIINNTLNGSYQVWKPSTNNPFSKGISGGSGGGGGGGGGGGSTSVSKSTQKMLDDMENKNDAYDNRLKLNDLRKEYHDIRGEIQGVIEYTKVESDIIKDQNKTLEENIAKLEAEIKANEEIMAKKKSSSRAYKQAETDLEALNKAHKEYTETLLENKNRLEEITKEIEDFKEQARQTLISVQDLIRDTLQAQADLKRDMLDGTVSLEDEILEVIRTRYEKEQEMAVETANKKIEAIQDEIDAIDELIDERRKLIDKEEQEDEIAELEAKIARISADPTRKKDLLQLQDELAKKRKELAWDTYEDEMNAQKDSLNDQITNLEDYIEYVNDYYEELFNNPYKLIEEMKGVMSMTDEEIIKWLTINHNEYSKYTEAKQEQMRESWKEMVDQMRGITETFNEEVEAVMQMTDEEIIAWLKKYNIEFQNATKEQQESFIKSWQDTLDAWRNAYKEVAADVSNTSYTPTSSGSGGSSGGGGGGGGGGSSSTAKPKTQYTGTAEYQYRIKDGSWKKMTQINASYVSKEDAISIAKEKGKAAAQKLVTYTGAGTTVRLIKAYRDGGLASSTGLAWLDGTKSRPERILSPYQTQLFEDMIKTLHEIKTINVGNIMSSKAPDMNSSIGGLTIEQIQVNVEKLETDADYEEMANRVGEKLKEKITKGMAIGGIII